MDNEKNDMGLDDFTREIMDEATLAMARELRRVKTERDKLQHKVDELDALRIDEYRGMLTGPDYADLGFCNDGRVFARTAEDQRKAWIRTFSAYALPEALRDAHVHDRSDPASVAASYSYSVALQVWETLEAGFAAEAAAEVAQVKITKGEDDGESTEP